MTSGTKKRVALLSVIALIVGIGLPTAAVKLGEQMQQVPLDKMALFIEIVQGK